MPNPSGNYIVHFGVKPEHLDLVVPGVLGLDTHQEFGSWAEWDDRPGRRLEEEGVHITINTTTPFPTMLRALSQYGPYMIPRKYDDHDWRGTTLLLVSDASDQFAQDWVGCYTLYAGERERPNNG